MGGEAERESGESGDGQRRGGRIRRPVGVNVADVPLDHAVGELDGLEEHVQGLRQVDGVAPGCRHEEPRACRGSGRAGRTRQPGWPTGLAGQQAGAVGDLAGEPLCVGLARPVMTRRARAKSASGRPRRRNSAISPRMKVSVSVGNIARMYATVLTRGNPWPARRRFPPWGDVPRRLRGQQTLVQRLGRRTHVLRGECRSAIRARAGAAEALPEPQHRPGGDGRSRRARPDLPTGHTYPVSPCTTSSALAPASVTTQGRPRVAASMTAFGMPSRSEVMRKTSRPLMRSATSSRSPVSRTFFSRPRCWIRARSSASSGPPPTKRKVACGCVCRTSSATSSVSG